MSERQDQIRKDRGAYYGPVGTNHRAIGMAWGGILLQAMTSGRWMPGDPVPAEIVTLCMAAVKLSREAFMHKPDNIDDGCNYLRFSGEIAEAPAVTYSWTPDGAKTIVPVVEFHHERCHVGRRVCRTCGNEHGSDEHPRECVADECKCSGGRTFVDDGAGVYRCTTCHKPVTVEWHRP